MKTALTDGTKLSVGVIGANSSLAKVFIDKYQGTYDFKLLYRRLPDPPTYDLPSTVSWDRSFSKNDFNIVFASHVPKRNESVFGKIRCFISNIKIALQARYYLKGSTIIFSSSTSVYRPSNQIITSHTVPHPQNLYGWSKLLSEKILWSTAPIIIRWTSLFGHGIRNHSLVNFFIQAATQGKISLIGDSQRQQDYLHLERAADFLHNILQHPRHRLRGGHIYLGASFQSISNHELAKLIGQTFSQHGRRVQIDEPNGLIKNTSIGFCYGSDDQLNLENMGAFDTKEDIEGFVREVI